MPSRPLWRHCDNHYIYENWSRLGRGHIIVQANNISRQSINDSLWQLCNRLLNERAFPDKIVLSNILPFCKFSYLVFISSRKYIFMYLSYVIILLSIWTERVKATSREKEGTWVLDKVANSFSIDGTFIHRCIMLFCRACSHTVTLQWLS